MASVEVKNLTSRLLGALVPVDRDRIAPYLQEQELERGRILYAAGAPITHIYFLHSGIISLEVASSEGALVEAATIGNEGAIGLGGLLAGDSSFTQQVVELPGRASVIDRRMFLQAVNESASLRSLLWSYSDNFASHVLQMAACNALHDAEERLARGLLLLADRWHESVLPVTQEVLSKMLGVRRSTVTLAAHVMQTAGLISYKRGRLAILDRSGLAELSCECYRVLSELQSRLPRES